VRKRQRLHSHVVQASHEALRQFRLVCHHSWDGHNGVDCFSLFVHVQVDKEVCHIHRLHYSALWNSQRLADQPAQLSVHRQSYQREQRGDLLRQESYHGQQEHQAVQRGFGCVRVAQLGPTDSVQPKYSHPWPPVRPRRQTAYTIATLPRRRHPRRVVQSALWLGLPLKDQKQGSDSARLRAGQPTYERELHTCARTGHHPRYLRQDAVLEWIFTCSLRRSLSAQQTRRHCLEGFNHRVCSHETRVFARQVRRWLRKNQVSHENESQRGTNWTYHRWRSDRI